MKRLVRVSLIFSALVLCGFLVSSASAERSRGGDVIVSLNGGISPLALPRHEQAPVAVRLAGRVLTANRSPLPRVNWIKLELAWRGVLDTKGLAVCPKERLKSTDSIQAMKYCGPAKVGAGRLYARIFLPGQNSFGVHAHIVAFNGRSKIGRPEVLVHAWSESPPVSFVIPFRVQHHSGAFRTVLVALIRRSAGPWPHVANFQITVGRSFNYAGKKRSYLKASCPVPKNFTAGFLSFARATYMFEGGKQLTTESVRSCRARQ